MPNSAVEFNYFQDNLRNEGLLFSCSVKTEEYSG